MSPGVGRCPLFQHPSAADGNRVAFAQQAQQRLAFPLEQREENAQHPSDEEGQTPDPSAFANSPGTVGLGREDDGAQQKADADGHHDELRGHADAEKGELMAAAPAHQNRVDGQHDHQAGARQHDGQRQDQSAAGVMAGAQRLAHGRATVQKRGRICSGTDAGRPGLSTRALSQLG